jgi:HNH endonuclease
MASLATRGRLVTDNRRREFSLETKLAALARQDHRCGSCGVHIHGFGKNRAAEHAFGEWAEAHHIRHFNAGGLSSLANCIVICKTCHYSAHIGGNFRNNSEEVQGAPEDFVCFDGLRNLECRTLAAEMDEKFGKKSPESAACHCPRSPTGSHKNSITGSRRRRPHDRTSARRDCAIRPVTWKGREPVQ